MAIELKELYKKLQELIDVYESNFNNDIKYEKVSKLWTDYYQLSNELDIQLDFAYQIFLLYENECYKIQQEPNLEMVDGNVVKGVVSRLKDVLVDRNRGIDIGISESDVEILLKWSVSNARSGYQIFGIDLIKNSLNGFCQIGQALSLMPLEKLGLSVTKNTAKNSFGYPFTHAFGTVCFPVMDEDGNVTEKNYLIDTTYRQFFSSVRCHYGRYYTKEENTGMIANPDPGYFVEDKEFAIKLMKDGFLLLDEESAMLYGKPFYLSSLELQSFEKLKDKNIHYYEMILNDRGSYSVNMYDLEGLNVSFPDSEFTRK